MTLEVTLILLNSDPDLSNAGWGGLNLILVNHLDFGLVKTTIFQAQVLVREHATLIGKALGLTITIVYAAS